MTGPAAPEQAGPRRGPDVSVRSALTTTVVVSAGPVQPMQHPEHGPIQQAASRTHAPGWGRVDPARPQSLMTAPSQSPQVHYGPSTFFKVKIGNSTSTEQLPALDLPTSSSAPIMGLLQHETLSSEQMQGRHTRLQVTTPDEGIAQSRVPGWNTGTGSRSGTWTDEIQPIVDEPSHAQKSYNSQSRSKAGRSSTSPPVSIPASGAWGTASTRTYRVVISPQPSHQGEPSPLTAVNVKQVTVDRVGGAEPVPVPAPSTSYQPRGTGFFGSLSRSIGLIRASQQELAGPSDLLPHNYRASPNPEALLSSSPLDVGSVLGRASGTLRHKNSNKMAQVEPPPSGATPDDTKGRPGTLSEATAGSSSIIKRAYASVDNLNAMLSGAWPRPLDLRGGSGAATPGPGAVDSTTPSANNSVRGGLKYPQMAEKYGYLNHGGTGAGVSQGGWGSAPAGGLRLGSSGGAGDRLLQASVSRGHSTAYGPGGYPPHPVDPYGYPDHNTHSLYSHSMSPGMPIGRAAGGIPRSSSLLALLQMEANDSSTMCAADIAVLSSSMPASFGHPTATVARRVDSIAGSPGLSRAASTVGGSHDGWGLALAGATSGRLQRNDSDELPPSLPICLICLEMLDPKDFATGEAMQLECLCKGEVAMRHRACAIEWSNVKGNLICDICKTPIRNLPDIDPAIVAAREEARRRRQPLFAIHPDPTTADYVFDAIRVGWITVICCILFMEDVSMTRAFTIGACVGVIYCLLSMLFNWLWMTWRRRAQARRLAAAQQQPAEATSGYDGSGHTSGGDHSLVQPLLIPGQAGTDIV